MPGKPARGGLLEWRHMNPSALMFSAALLLTAGCAAKPEFIARPFVPPGRLAVLPFANESNSLEAPGYLRQIVHRALKDAGYDLLPLDSVDAKLKQAGITQAGQLDATSPQELSDSLGASALF